MRSTEFLNDITPEIQQLIDIAEQTGNKMASSRTLSLQLHVPRKISVSEDMKPNAELWTSTAIFRGNNSYTSEWAEWCSREMPEWLAPKGKLYKLQPGAKILNIGSDAAAKKIAKILGHTFTGGPYAILGNYPWNMLKFYFDAIRYPARLKTSYRSRNANILMSMWDVESTAWFNTDKLKLIGDVDINVRNW